MHHSGQQPVILVGVGGSGASLAALSWAASEARRRDATLWVIQAWQAHPARALYAGSHGQQQQPSEATAARQLAATVHAAAGGRPGAEPVIELIEGVAERILAHASAEADLLVLGAGSQSPGIPADPLCVDRPIGPVIRACLSHAHCPVVIIGPAMAAEQDPGGTGHADASTAAARA